MTANTKGILFVGAMAGLGYVLFMKPKKSGAMTDSQIAASLAANPFVAAPGANPFVDSVLPPLVPGPTQAAIDESMSNLT